jgi:hypothetical protein
MRNTECVRAYMHGRSHARTDSPVIFTRMSGTSGPPTRVSFPVTNVTNERVIAPHGWRSCWHFLVSVRACEQIQVRSGGSPNRFAWKTCEYERQVNKEGCQWPHLHRCQDAWMTPVFDVTLRVPWLSETVGTNEMQVAILNSCRTNLSVCPLCLSVNSASVKSWTSEVPTDP